MSDLAIILLGLWALAASGCAWRWRRAYQEALAQFSILLSVKQQQGLTPHQRGVLTRRANELARMRAHREELELGLAERADPLVRSGWR